MIIDFSLANEKLHFKSIDAKVYAKQITKWLNDPYLNKYLAVRHKLVTESEEIEHIESLNSSTMAYYFGIFQNASQELIGTATCRIKNSSTLELGILIGEKGMHGKGLGASSLFLCETFARTLNLKRLSAGIECDNQASIALFLKMSYKFDNDVIGNEFGTKCFQVSKNLSYNDL